MDGYWKIEIPRWWLLTGETKPERELPRGILVRLGHGQGGFYTAGSGNRKDPSREGTGREARMGGFRMPL
jgi:hypothetical protein